MHIGPILRAMKYNRTRVILIVLEIAMTLAIVTNCVNVILTERAKMAQTSGLDDANIVRLNVKPFGPEFRDEAFLNNILDADVRTIESVPGVKAASNTHLQLWEGGGSSTAVKGVGTKDEPVSTQIYYGTKDLVPALGANVIAGRGFRDGDHGVGNEPDPATNVIITKSVADLAFPHQNPLGKQIYQALKPDDPVDTPLTVIGVIRDFYNPFGRDNDLQALSDRAIFLPSRVGGSNQMAYLIRCEPGAMSTVIPEIEKRLMAANSNRIFEFTRTTEKKDRWFSNGKIVVTTMTCIIITLIAITALGLVGLTSLSVAERTKQIGTRRALGATRGDILRHFLLENWLLTTAGLVLGVAGAYALDFLLVSHVSDTKMAWQLVAGGMLLLWISGLLSTIPAALRAATVAPSIATRSV